MRRLLLLIPACMLAVALLSLNLRQNVVKPSLALAQSSPSATDCSLKDANGNPDCAFFDTFNQPMPTGSRTGDLGPAWGVSKQTGNQGLGSNTFAWPASINDACGQNLQVQPGGDWVVCNGRMIDSLDDLGGIPNNASYVKQPFDWAGRTGKVVFDVSNDTGGTHAAWPEFWITNLPVPAPFNPPQANGDQSAYWDNAQFAVGIQLGAQCLPGEGSNCGTNCGGNTQPVAAISDIQTITNYVMDRLSFQNVNCVVESPGPDGPLNHYEVDISTTNLSIYGTDAGSSTLKLLASVPVNLAFTRGFIWLNDVHYNGDKYCPDEEPGIAFNPYYCQRVHSFAWANVGFDGPVLPRDLSYDVLDALTADGTDAVSNGVYTANLPVFNLGWYVYQGHPASLTTMSVPQEAIGAATGAVLTFDAYDQQAPGSFAITLNGHPYTFTPPAGTLTFAVPVQLADTVAGSNSITIETDSPSVGANVASGDLKFLGAGGVPSAACIDPSSAACVAGPQPTPSPSPSPTPLPPSPSPSPSPSGAGITCPTSTFRVTILNTQTISASCS